MASSLGKPVRWNLFGDKHRARSLVYEAKRLLYILPSLQRELKQYGIFRRFHNGAYVRIKEVFGQLIVDMFYPTMGEVLRVSDVESVHELYVLKEGYWVDKYVPISGGLKKVWEDKRLEYYSKTISVDNRYIYVGPNIYSKTDCEFLATVYSAIDFESDLVSGGVDEDDGFYLAGYAFYEGTPKSPRWVVAKVEKNHKRPKLMWSKNSRLSGESFYPSSNIRPYFIRADGDGVFVAGLDMIDPYSYLCVRVEKRNRDTGDLEWTFSSWEVIPPDETYWNETINDIVLGRDYIYMAHFRHNNDVNLLILDKNTGALVENMQIESRDSFITSGVLSDSKGNIYIHGSYYPSVGGNFEVIKIRDGSTWRSGCTHHDDPTEYGSQMALLGSQVVSAPSDYKYKSGSWIWEYYLESRDVSSGTLLHHEGPNKGMVYGIASYNKTKVIK